jgi:anaphase-promoting complex subunit 4
MVSFRYLDERHISGEIDLMKWNPKMDLIVLSLISGDIILHRLVSWQKVWHLPKHKLKTINNSDNDQNCGSNSNKCKVRDIDWRPDGRILAIAYDYDIDSCDPNDGKSCIVLHDVETSHMIHKFVIDGKVSSICWEEKKLIDLKSDKTKKDNDSQQEFHLDTNCTAISPFIGLLPKAKGVSKSYVRASNRKLIDESINDLMKVENQKTLNVLAIGTKNGFIELYAFGVYKIAKLVVGNDISISYLSLSSDLGMINVLVENRVKDSLIEYSMINYSLDVLKQRSHEILMISQIYAQSISLLIYLNETMREILEAWEDVMVEIDSKLSNYGSHYKSQSKENSDFKETKIPLMADEFLELLVFGNASDSLEKFLSDLTDKGLKKLGHSIELAYSNIQKLVVKNVQRVSQHLFCHFNSLKGMALWEEKFGDVGLDIMSVNRTLKSIGSFLLKSTELQQVIDNSMRNVKAFIRWLYTAMVRLFNSDTTTQSDLTKVSQQDIQFVTEFIKENFEFETLANTSRPSSSNFTLERVGQYLKDKSLNSINSSINDMSINPWIQYLNERPHLTITDDNTLFLYRQNPETSFVTEHKMMDSSVREAFTGPFNVITDSIGKNGLRRNISNIITLPNDESIKLNHISNMSLGYYYIAFLRQTKPAQQLFIIRYSIENQYSVEIVSATFMCQIMSSNCQLLVVDYQFYTEDIISLLLMEPESSQSYLLQLPLNLLNINFKPIPIETTFGEELQPIIIDLSNASPDSGLIYRSLDNMKSCLLAVSGSRKVACVSFSSKRRVRLFEMDVSEDEEEEHESDRMTELNTSTEQDRTLMDSSFNDISIL